MTQNCIVYYVDKNNKLIDLDDNWDRFALANNAPQLVREKVIEKPLFDLISDPQSSHLYKLLIERIKHTGDPIAFEFRCDSPDKRRFMHMEMTHQKATDGICFISTLERQEPREPVKLLDTADYRSNEILIICSWCKKIKIDEQIWTEVEDGIKLLGLFDAEPLPKLSHGMCPSCRKSIWRKLVE